MGKGPEQTFPQRRFSYMKGQQVHANQVPNITHHEMQIKTTMRYHLPVRGPQLQSQEMANAGEDTKQRELLCTVGGNANWCSCCGKQYGGSSKS